MDSAELKEKVSVPDLLDRLGFKWNSNNKMICPFHDEKTPSVHVEKRLWNCFGCKAGGDIISFVEQLKGYSCNEAIKFICEEFGLEYNNTGGSKPRVLDKLAKDYHRHLKVNWSQYKPFMDRRGLSDHIENWMIGAAPDKHYLHDWRVKNGYSQSDVSVVSDIRGRVTFPSIHYNVENIYGRSNGTPKYKGMAVKSASFFGWNRAIRNIKQSREACLVEGQIDAIKMHLIGKENTIAISGAFTDAKADMILPHVDSVTIVLDSDNAGIGKKNDIAIKMLERSCYVEVINIPDGLDPDDCYEKGIDLPEPVCFIQDVCSRVVAKNKMPVARKFLQIARKSKSEIFEEIILQEVANGLELEVNSIRKDYDENRV